MKTIYTFTFRDGLSFVTGATYAIGLIIQTCLYFVVAPLIYNGKALNYYSDPLDIATLLQVVFEPLWFAALQGAFWTFFWIPYFVKEYLLPTILGLGLYLRISLFKSS